MAAEENKALVRRILEEVWNKGNLAAIDELFAPTHVRHDPANPGVQDRDGVRQLVTMYRSAFPDLQFTVEDQIAEGDTVVTRYTGRGTHKGALPGIPATGKQATVSGIAISRIVGGKDSEEWVNYDALGLMQQLGAIPQMAQTGA
jgi:steroid delta-isomerase-like uncharacterized protein